MINWNQSVRKDVEKEIGENFLSDERIERREIEEGKKERNEEN